MTPAFYVFVVMTCAVAALVFLGVRAICAQALWQRRREVLNAEFALRTSREMPTAILDDYFQKGERPPSSYSDQFSGHMRLWRSTIVIFWNAKENLDAIGFFCSKDASEFREFVENKIYNQLDYAAGAMKSKNVSGEVFGAEVGDNAALHRHLLDFVDGRLKMDRARARHAREELERANA